MSGIFEKCGVRLKEINPPNSRDFDGFFSNREARGILKVHLKNEIAVICCHLDIRCDLRVAVPPEEYFYVSYYQKITGKVVCGGKSFSLSSDTLYTSSGAREDVETTFSGNSRLIGFAVFFSTDTYMRQMSLRFNRAVYEPSSLSMMNGCRHFPELVKILRQLLDYDGSGQFAELFYLSKVQEILVYVLQRMVESGNSCSLDKGELSDEGAIAHVRNYIAAHLDEDVTNAQLSVLACMSQAKLKYTFRRVTGLTISEYKTAVRLGRARRLLTETDSPISSIAVMCGFRSASGFTAFFRNHVGVTPSEYRAGVR